MNNQNNLSKQYLLSQLSSKLQSYINADMPLYQSYVGNAKTKSDIMLALWFNDGRIFPKKSEAKKLGEDLKFIYGYDYIIIKTNENYHCKFKIPNL